METQVNEIADGIYRLSTYVPDIAPPAGFTFNQFLVLGDEPLMFHTGLRKMFPLNRDAVSRIIPPETPALDCIRSFRGRRMWRHERMARHRAAGSGGARPDRLHGVAQRFRRPRPARARRRRGDRPRRRQAGALHRHAAHPAWLGRRRSVSRNQLARCCAATCSPNSATAQPLTDGDVVGPAIAAEDVFKYSSLVPAWGRRSAPVEARAAHARAHARAVILRRWRRGASRAWLTTTTAGCPTRFLPSASAPRPRSDR